MPPCLRGKESTMAVKKRSILFITWDGPQTNYLESLFFPIFEGLQDWDFHVIQFSWAGAEKQLHLADVAKKRGIRYTHFNIIRKPHPLLCTPITLGKGISFLKKYIRENGIWVIMPRSTFPAVMAKAAKRAIPELKVVFDADGLPLEERVDFSGLNPKGLQYRFLKSQEQQLLKQASLVLTRSAKAIQFHLNGIGEEYAHKFFKVANGRDEEFFKIDLDLRVAFRKKLQLKDTQLLLVYGGSLGPQYGWEIMLKIFEALLEGRPDSRFLVLTGNPDYLKDKIPRSVIQNIIIHQCPYRDIPAWLNAADVALAIRKPMPSMQGVAPIKLGEYLMMGLPTIASKGIGDTEEVLKGQPFVYLFNHQNQKEAENVMNWVNQCDLTDKKAIRQFAVQYFTLNRSILDYKTALGTLDV